MRIPSGIHRNLHDWLVWVILLCGVLSWVGFLDIARDIGRPFGGYIGFRRTSAPIGEVDANTPIWWAGMVRDRLDHGDLILRVDGRLFYPDPGQAYQRVADAGSRSIRLETVDAQSEIAATGFHPVLTFTLSHYLDVRLPDMIMSVVFWLLAIVVYTSWPGGPANRAFALSAAVVGLVRALYVHTVFMEDAFSYGLEFIQLLALPLVGVTVFHFAGQFPAPARPMWHRLTLLGLVIALLSALAAIAARWPAVISPPFPPDAWFADVGYFGTLFLYAVGFVALIGRLIIRVTRHRAEITRRERRTVQIVLLGLLVAMPIIVASVLSWVVINGRHVSYYWQGLDIRYLLLAVPLSLAYVLVRYQALRSPSPLFILVMLLSASALLAAIGAFFWTLTHDVWPASALRPPFASLFFAGFASGLLWLMLTSWRGPLGRYFQHERHSYASAQAFGRRVMGETDLRRLPETISQAIVDELGLERAAVWVRGPSDELSLAAVTGRFGEPPPAYLDVRSVNSVPAPLHLDRADQLPPWLQPLMGKELDLAVPLQADSSLIGLLGLGPHWDEQIFDERIVEIAELIGQQATLFLIAAKNINELRRVPGRLSDVQERERERLAQELHDTIQQFLGRLPFYLAVGRDSVYVQPDLTHEILDRAIDDVDAAAGEVRQIRHNLSPSRLERGLSPALAALTRHFQERTGITTSLQATGDVDHLLDLKTSHAIYRVIQQALDNVEAHAAATTAVVCLEAAPDRVVFAVRDDGCGFSDVQRQAALRRGSFGLESMRARLDACGGDLQIESVPGRGTEIAGWVPRHS